MDHRSISNASPSLPPAASPQHSSKHFGNASPVVELSVASVESSSHAHVAAGQRKNPMDHGIRANKKGVGHVQTVRSLGLMHELQVGKWDVGQRTAMDSLKTESGMTADQQSVYALYVVAFRSPRIWAELSRKPIMHTVLPT